MFGNCGGLRINDFSLHGTINVWNLLRTYIMQIKILIECR